MVCQHQRSFKSPQTPALLKKAVEAHPGQHVILSFDNDERGREYALDAQALLEERMYQIGKELRIRAPQLYKDWNEQLVSDRRLASFERV